MTTPTTLDLDDFLTPLVINTEKLFNLTEQLSKNFKSLAATSSEQFLPTPINILPQGTEQGRFLAIDVGGSNLRVCFIELFGPHPAQEDPIRSIHHKSWPIEEHVKNDKAADLFDWIGGCIAEVVMDCHKALLEQGASAKPLGEEIPIGITFSFPMIQKSISEAILMPMGKGFAINSNLNLASLVLEGYSRHRDLPQNSALPSLHIAAIANDAVSTLASLAYYTRRTSDAKNPTRTAMGLIVGTGSNAALPIPLSHLSSTKRDPLILPTTSNPTVNAASPHSNSVIVNTEFTLRGTTSTLQAADVQTTWDAALNAAVEIPGHQPYEYMIAGRYLGELVRLVFHDWLTKAHGLDSTRLPAALRTRRGIPTLFLSDHAGLSAPTSWLRALRREFPDDKDGWAWNEQAALAFMKITHAVQKRASRLVAAAVVGLLICAEDVVLSGNGSKSEASGGAEEKERAGKVAEEIAVAYAGGVIERFPGFLETCQHALDEIVEGVTRRDVVRRVVLREAPEGGVIGAGVLAGTVWNLDKA